MKKAVQAFAGAWRITGMEVWDVDYFDMEVPAHITIRKDPGGRVRACQLFCVWKVMR